MSDETFFVDIDFKSENCLLMSYLFSNETLKADQLSKKTGMDRSTIYRHLDELQTKGIVARTGMGVINYFILNKQKPFENMIKKRQNEIQKLQSFIFPVQKEKKNVL